VKGFAECLQDLKNSQFQFRILIVNDAMGQQASDFAPGQVAAEEHATALAVIG
jgi:hypothetical protein